MSASDFESHLKELAEAEGVSVRTMRGVPFKDYTTIVISFPVADDACLVRVQMLNNGLDANIAKFVLDQAKEEFETAKKERRRVPKEMYDHQPTVQAECEHQEKIDVTAFGAKRWIYLCLNCGAEIPGEPIEAP